MREARYHYPPSKLECSPTEHRDPLDFRFLFPTLATTATWTKMLHKKGRPIKSKIHCLGHIFESNKRAHKLFFLLRFLDLYYKWCNWEV